MGGTTTDDGAAFDFDGERIGWRLFSGHGLAGIHCPSPYLHGGKAALKKLCKAARRRGWPGLVELAQLLEPQVAGWLNELDEQRREPMVTALRALASEL